MPGVSLLSTGSIHKGSNSCYPGAESASLVRKRMPTRLGGEKARPPAELSILGKGTKPLNSGYGNSEVLFIMIKDTLLESYLVYASKQGLRHAPLLQLRGGGPAGSWPPPPAGKGVASRTKGEI